MTKILLYGGSGLVGSRVLDLLSEKLEIIAPSHDQVELTNFNSVSKNIEEVNPELVFYAAGYTNVDKAEEESDLCFTLNTKVIEAISDTANLLSIPLYYLSTDYVFNGQKADSPYTEEDTPDPLGVYAKSKAEGERITLERNSRNSVLRLVMPYSAHFKRKMDLVRTILERLRNGEKVSVILDQKINPIFVDDFVMGAEKILEKKSSGIYHLAASNFTTPFDLARLIAEKFELDKNLIEKTSFEEFSKRRAAKRPKDSWLSTEKFRNEFGNDILHTIEEGLELFKSKLR